MVVSFREEWLKVLLELLRVLMVILLELLRVLRMVWSSV